MLTGIIFSRDRALQLDAALRSYLLHCQDAHKFELFVLYTTSSPLHAQQYAQLVQEFQPHAFIHFVREHNFRRDVLKLLAYWAGISGWRKLAFIGSLIPGHRIGAFGNWLLKNKMHNYVIFLVDDNLFVQDFFLGHALLRLKENPQALGFSLRLGKNSLFSYMLDRPQALPAFTEIADGILQYDWTLAQHDFAYPLEVSGSVFRIDNVLPNLNLCWFANPNWMESRLAAFRDTYRSSHPYLLCFENSVTFCVPVNRVEPRYKNRAGINYSYTVQYLAEQYAAGKRLDVAAYSGYLPYGCHQEVELVFTSGES